MSWLAKSAAWLMAARPSARFEEAASDPERAQRQVLAELLRRNASTVFGREHGFSAIDGPEEYRKKVAVRDYEGLRPYMRRMLEGEQGVLTAEAPLRFVTTSGTTGEPKFIPVTDRYRRQIRDVWLTWFARIVRDHAGAFDGRLLRIVGTASEGRTPSGLPFGQMSGVNYQNTPRLIRQAFVLPYEWTQIRDYDTRYFIAARLALSQPVTMITAPNASTLLRLAQVLETQTEALLRGVRDGTLGLDVGHLDDSQRSAAEAVRRRLAPDAARAKALEQAAKGAGRLAPSGCWPSLKVIGCWLGGSVGAQAQRLRPLYGEQVAFRDMGLLASEGRMTIPVEDDTAAGVLAVHASFFEFIPEDSIEDLAAPVKLAHELEAGRRYYILISGWNGLYRYDMNDIVEVRGFYRRAPKLAFVRKGRDMLNITGEKLHLNQVQAAVAEAQRSSGQPVAQFRLIPDVSCCRYDLLVEFADADRNEKGIDAFLSVFDSHLASLNIEYAAKRGSRRLHAPRLHVMRIGWSERLTREEFKRGRRQEQYKWKQMVQDWDELSRSDVARTFGDGRPVP